ncbi:MAG TPA: DNA recombination protein RmuC [Dermatophilaceae bacterium]|nr:DNA recombination protein RmuC [Dermatophilaceae bacterium]
MEIFIAAVFGMLIGAVVAWLITRVLFEGRSAALSTERDLMRERVIDLEATISDDAQTATMLAPLRDALVRVERQVGTLERDRVEQFSQVSVQLADVTTSTNALRFQTASLVGSLNASTIRGNWGEVQLRRVLEHAGMLARCDFEEQVSAVSSHERGVRPDVVVRLPGDKCLVIDAKAPLTAFLSAQADGIDSADRSRLLASHATSLRGHVDSLATKAYWSAFTNTPEMVVCFIPGDAILAAALAADPALFEYAQARRVVLASPGTLLALLRTVAFTWQQDALTANAQLLLKLGSELYSRLGTLGSHASRMGSSLQKSVESYNALVGALESRVMVTARKMHELGLAQTSLPEAGPVEAAPRPLTATELISALDPEVARPELDLSQVRELEQRTSGRHTA